MLEFQAKLIFAMDEPTAGVERNMDKEAFCFGGHHYMSAEGVNPPRGVGIPGPMCRGHTYYPSHPTPLVYLPHPPLA